jgi:hypothetical protein
LREKIPGLLLQNGEFTVFTKRVVLYMLTKKSIGNGAGDEKVFILNISLFKWLPISSKHNQLISGGGELKAQKPGFQNLGARLCCLRSVTYFAALESNAEPGKDRRVNDEKRIESRFI